MHDIHFEVPYSLLKFPPDSCKHLVDESMWRFCVAGGVCVVRGPPLWAVYVHILPSLVKGLLLVAHAQFEESPPMGGVPDVVNLLILPYPFSFPDGYTFKNQ